MKQVELRRIDGDIYGGQSNIGFPNWIDSNSLEKVKNNGEISICYLEFDALEGLAIVCYYQERETFLLFILKDALNKKEQLETLIAIITSNYPATPKQIQEIRDRMIMVLDAKARILQPPPTFSE